MRTGKREDASFSQTLRMASDSSIELEALREGEVAREVDTAQAADDTREVSGFEQAAAVDVRLGGQKRESACRATAICWIPLLACVVFAVLAGVFQGLYHDEYASHKPWMAPELLLAQVRSDCLHMNCTAVNCSNIWYNSTCSDSWNCTWPRPSGLAVCNSTLEQARINLRAGPPSRVALDAYAAIWTVSVILLIITAGSILLVICIVGCCRDSLELN